MGLQLLEAPEPAIALAEAKLHLRVTSNSEDSLIEGYVAAATGWVERFTDLSLMTRKYRLFLDAFTNQIKLPRGPVASVESVEYLDADGAFQMVNDETYTFDATSYRPWLILNGGAVWPSPLAAVNSVAVTYYAGSDVFPAQYSDIRQAILVLLTEFYENRSAGSFSKEVDDALCLLLDGYRTPTIA